MITWEQVSVVIAIVGAFCGSLVYVGNRIDGLTKVIAEVKELVLTEYVSDEKCKERRESCPARFSRD